MPLRLGDFDLKPRVLLICALALVVGTIAAFVAAALLMLIGLITNLVYYQRVAFDLVAPGGGPGMWWLYIIAPVAGGLIVGLMARYGSEAIRGHGMPEAINAILRGGSKIRPRVAILKPISAAITIGTGGPFGAEGPIIMTGGAFGSLLSQTLSLTADERKTLLVAGAAAGMAATFNAPLASILLAVELLLFEMRPRSFVPVTIAVVVATAIRWPLLGFEAIFETNYLLPTTIAWHHLLACVAVGAVGGFVAWFATMLVYLAEDGYRKLPIHWMWWPAIGGLIIGIGGLIEPRALGVGYDVIETLLHGEATFSLIVGILVVKTLIWALSLGSGTSGGVLAPVFMIGAALGALLAHVLPPVAPGFWALMSLAAVVGGVMRSPLTGVIFAMELTHQWDALLPLLVASTAAFLLSTLVLKRSILTEKVVRKGTHVTREYSVDPLEVLLCGEVMPRNFVSFRAGTSLAEAAREATGAWSGSGPRKLEHGQRLYPVLDDNNRIVGVITRHQLLDAALELGTTLDTRIDEVMIRDTVLGYPDMSLRELANLMAERKIANLPIVSRDDPHQVLSVMTIEHVLQARLVDLNEERQTERVINLPLIRAVRGGLLVMRRRRDKKQS